MFISIPILATIFIASCERRPLVDPDNSLRVEVAVDVSDVKNISCDIYNPAIQVDTIDPETMRVLFYDSDGESIVADTYISNSYVNEDGNKVLYGDVNINPGDYKMVIYNFDTEATLIRNAQEFNTIEAYTDNVSEVITKKYVSKVESDSLDVDHIMYEPDHLVVSSRPDLEIPYHEGVYTVKTDAYTVVDTYYLQIKVTGIKNAASASAILSGLSSSNFIATDSRVEDPEAIVYFTLQKSVDPHNNYDVICAVFNTFGKINGLESNLEVTFNVNTIGGRVINKSYPIGYLFQTPDAINHHWLLLEEVLDIPPDPTPDSPSGNGGWSPEVDEWEEENYDIVL